VPGAIARAIHEATTARVPRIIVVPWTTGNTRPTTANHQLRQRCGSRRRQTLPPKLNCSPLTEAHSAVLVTGAGADSDGALDRSYARRTTRMPRLAGIVRRSSRVPTGSSSVRRSPAGRTQRTSPGVAGPTSSSSSARRRSANPVRPGRSSSQERESLWSPRSAGGPPQYR